MPHITVQLLDVTAEGTWDFRTGRPEWAHHDYGARAQFDPFPAYRHDPVIAGAAAALAEDACPLLWDIAIYLADAEDTGRTNGYSAIAEPGHYQDPGGEYVKDPPVAAIVLGGKRIPPHPGMTRHLVAHELGHHVEYMLTYLAGARHLHDPAVAQEYARVRGLPADTPEHGRGGDWHRAVPEILADDFRILVTGAEPEYWPHPGVPRPEAVPAARSWWAERMAQLAEAVTAVHGESPAAHV
jgi:hypothetical protein